MEVDQEVSSSGYSSSSSYTVLGSNKWRNNVVVNFATLDGPMDCEAISPQTSTSIYSNEARYYALKQRRKEGTLQEDRAIRQQVLKNKRKRNRQIISDKNRSLYTSSEAEAGFEDDLESAMDVFGLETLPEGIYIDEIEVLDMQDSNLDELDMYGAEAAFELDESDLSDSEISFLGTESDTEREEDGYTTADFEDSESESDRDPEETDIISVVANGTEIVRIRFPFMSMRVFLSDFSCLMNDSFVNDTIVDFCLNNFVFNELPEDVYKIHTFPSTFFYYLQMQLFRDASKKSDEHAEKLLRRYSRLAPFVENEDVFENDFLVFPMNDLNHWSLCVVCCPNLLLASSQRHHLEKSNVIEPRPCIMLFDSQFNEQPNLDKYGANIREFLEFAYIYNHGFCEDLESRFSAANLPVVYPRRLPQQTNKYDCGVFLLEYARNFFLNPPNMKKAIQGDFDFLAEYPQFSTTNKRASLRKEILSMSEVCEDLDHLLS